MTKRALHKNPAKKPPKKTQAGAQGTTHKQKIQKSTQQLHGISHCNLPGPHSAITVK